MNSCRSQTLEVLYILNFVFDHVEIIAQYLKVAIDRRSSTVADYVESYLGAEERERFLEVVATKVRLMVEIREIQEKVGGNWKNLQDEIKAGTIL